MGTATHNYRCEQEGKLDSTRKESLLSIINILIIIIIGLKYTNYFKLTKKQESRHS